MQNIYKILCFFLLTSCMTTRPPLLGDIFPKDHRRGQARSVDSIDSLVDTRFQSSRENQSYAAPSLPEQANLHLGMAKQNVQIRLGSPNEVEVAGHPKYGNERWTYESGFATANGFMTEKQVIYFEDHRVVGWETD